ncbi:MAG TPA: SWIB/MDM2 domain-containing protein [Puia sp.]|jgi:chromatin remodeling complex protein RSC6
MAKSAKKAAKKVAKKAPKKAAKKAVKKAAPKKAAKKAAPKKAAKKAAPKKAAKKKTARKPNAAFMTPLTVSDALAKVVGNKPMPRTEIVKKIWVYIKKNDLQDKANRRMINADANLKPIFVKDQISMFEMAGALNKHVK